MVPIQPNKSPPHEYAKLVDLKTACLLKESFIYTKKKSL